MNVEIGAEAALFPEKEYIKGFSLQCNTAIMSSSLSSLFVFSLIVFASRRVYTVIRIDGRIHQAHRMAPDQTIRLM
jgi:hypothetical protein